MREEITMFKFQPRLDADFFTNDLPELVKEAPKKPTMSGLALEEGLIFGTLHTTFQFLKNLVLFQLLTPSFPMV